MRSLPHPPGRHSSSMHFRAWAWVSPASLKSPAKRLGDSAGLDIERSEGLDQVVERLDLSEERFELGQR